jgi:hypothetical protein
MIKALIVVFLFFEFSGISQVLMKFERDTVLLFEYSGGDEFNATRLNDEVWKNGLGGRRVLMSQDLAFSPENVSVEGGLLRLKATLADSLYHLMDYEIDSSVLKTRGMTLDQKQFRIKYAAGGIVSRKKVHYGLYELRFKVESDRGIWPAFWFYGGYKNEEIDAVELKGERNNEVHVDTHCPNGCDHGYKNSLGMNSSYGAWLPLSGFLHDGFNIMQLEWRKDEVFFYMNGFPLAYFKGNFSNPMSIYINTSVAKTGEAFSPGPDESTHWPSTYYVDYLRCWTPAKSNEVTLYANKTTADCRLFGSTYAVKPIEKHGLVYRRKKLRGMDGTIVINCYTKDTLSICRLGKISEESIAIVLKGKYTDVEVRDFGTEALVPFDMRDVSIAVTITSNSRNRRFNMAIGR